MNKVEDKARVYLSEGKICVVDLADGNLRGYAIGSSMYDVQFDSTTGWICNCPAYTECAHIVAFKLITNLHRDETPHLGTSTDNYDDLFKRTEPEEESWT